MIWSRATDVLWRTAPAFLALCAVDGAPTAVTGPGADVWDELATPQDLESLTAAVARRYGVPAERISGDVAELLERLRAGGYVVAGS